MSENDQDMLDEDKEAELLQALAAQAPAEEYVATSGEALPEGALLAARDDIVDALKTVSDPEIPINIYDMGFVYDIRQLNNGNVEIDMTRPRRPARWRAFCRSRRRTRWRLCAGSDR